MRPPLVTMIELGLDTPQEELVHIKATTREMAKTSGTKTVSEVRNFGRFAVTYTFDPDVRIGFGNRGRGTWTCNGLRIGESHLRLRLRALLHE